MQLDYTQYIELHKELDDLINKKLSVHLKDDLATKIRQKREDIYQKLFNCDDTKAKNRYLLTLAVYRDLLEDEEMEF